MSGSLMKKIAISIMILFCFVAMLFSPKTVFIGAREGLLLWFQILLPTLFPFLIITNLLLYTDSIFLISNIAGPILHGVFKVSKNGSFAVITGFLCGYPIGAKVTANLVENGQISKEEGCYLLSFCNNTSPVFILNYLVWKTLKQDDLMLPSLIILILSPILISMITRRWYIRKKQWIVTDPTYHLAKKKLNFGILDECIMNSFETITQVGGYIILFSVLLALFQKIAFEFPMIEYILPIFEVTNGILLLGEMDIPIIIQYPLLLALTSFGGLCSIAQTQCMVQKAELPIIPYVIEKLATALAASLLAVIYLFYIH